MIVKNINIRKKEVILLGNISVLSEEDQQTVDFLNIKEVYSEPTFALAEKLSLISQKSTAVFFVICGTKKVIAQWSNLLVSYGMNYGENFVDFVFIKHYLKKSEAITKKKLIVAYGNCQMHDYYDCLNRCPDFVKKYDSSYFKYEKYARWEEEQVENLLCFADVFIITKESFDKKHRDLEKFVIKNNPFCRIISIPCYSFRGVFPQTNPHIQEQNKFDIVQDIFNTFHREDIYSNRMIDAGKSIESIIAQYQSETTFEGTAIKKLFELSLKQLAMMDRASDIKIYNYVNENVTSRRLFKDPVHMEDELVWHLTRQILNILECNAPENNLGGTIHYFSELPIYPEVASTLGLKWWDHNSKCELRMSEGMLLVTPKEFIERYYLFCKNVHQIKKSLHINKEDEHNVLEFFKI